ncbi:Transmembrane prolyl 4-hydroxylase [Tetrabaena socialis]|uniref:Transmembrane prolyl 4-hydroxylase n=1 Tax=Tetrabaena socialis TaxID=47790 RepID=A0A2J8AH61_9CHLO|nr:Transmembrane prolyl 4-hydroxylase [Tetrabaena socialis]|eukprot:PNH11859.1 Transmembrane prolyl 4-hydroxylase [Tetrabaena socialis]
MAPIPPAAPDTIEAWNEKDQKITVAEGNGYNLTLRAKIEHTADDIYHILTDPNTVTIFRSIKGAASVGRVVWGRSSNNSSSPSLMGFEALDRVEDWRNCDDGSFKYMPRMGDAVLFWGVKPNGEIDPHALHGGCPVKRGEKWVATKWIRSRGAAGY